jgi:hypothetical protein
MTKRLGDSSTRHTQKNAFSCWGEVCHHAAKLRKVERKTKKLVSFFVETEKLRDFCRRVANKWAMNKKIIFCFRAMTKTVLWRKKRDLGVEVPQSSEKPL